MKSQHRPHACYETIANLEAATVKSDGFMAFFAQVNILIALIYNGAATKKGSDEINLIIAIFL